MMKATHFYSESGILFCRIKTENVVTEKEIIVTISYILEYDYESNITAEIIEQKVKQLFSWRGRDFFESYEYPDDLYKKAEQIAHKLFPSFFNL